MLSAVRLSLCEFQEQNWLSSTVRRVASAYWSLTWFSTIFFQFSLYILFLVCKQGTNGVRDARVSHIYEVAVFSFVAFAVVFSYTSLFVAFVSFAFFVFFY